jgi:hypothetical protein
MSQPAIAERAAERPGIADRILGLVGDDDPATLGAKVMALRRLLFLHLAAESWFRFAMETPRSPWSFGIAVLYLLCLGLGWLPRYTRSAGEVALVVVAAQVVHTFPMTANHLYLELFAVLLVALFDPSREDEARPLLQGLRWLVVLVFFYSGLKKLYYGYYFDATFFGHMISLDARFADFFRVLLPAEEFRRLDLLAWPSRLGEGPYRIDSPVAVLLSNAVWVLEIGTALALLVRRLRPYALILGVLTVLGIELAAREAFFGALYVNLLLLFAPRDLNRRLLPAFVAFYAALTLITVGLVARRSIT